MSYRFRTRNARSKKSLSEKFEIGKGRYVDDSEFYSTFKEDNVFCETSELGKQKTISHESNLDFESSTNSNTVIKSVTCESRMGRYVHNVEFSQPNDSTNLSNSECEKSITKYLSEKEYDHSNTKESNFCNEKSIVPSNISNTSTTAQGLINNSGDKRTRPNFRKLHEEYKIQ